MNTRKPARSTAQFFLMTVALIGACALDVYAFSEPSSTPPAGDAYAPINTGPDAQDKNDAASHGAWITTDGIGSRYGALLATLSGTVGVGTTNPQGTLDVDSGVHDATICLNGTCISEWPTPVCGGVGSTYKVYTQSEITYNNLPLCSYYGTSYTTWSNSRGCPRGYNGGSVATDQARQFCQYKGWQNGAPLAQTNAPGTGNTIIMSGYVMPNGPAGMCGAIVGCSYIFTQVLCYNSL